MPKLFQRLLPLLLLLLAGPARADFWAQGAGQPYQTSFVNVTVDRVAAAFQDAPVYQVDPASGSLQLAIPIGPGIGEGPLRFTPTVTSRQAQELTRATITDGLGTGDYHIVNPSFMSILPGYLDLKTGPELDSDETTYVSQYEVCNGVAGSLDGPATAEEARVDGAALLRAFGYPAAAVPEMPLFGLQPSGPFVKYTSTGDLFIAMEDADSPRFTLRVGNSHYPTPGKALIIRQGLACEFTSVYRGAEVGGRYSVRLNRFRLTGLRTKAGQRIDIAYAGGPNNPDYTAEWFRDGQSTGVRVVFRREGGAIRIDYPDDGTGAAASFTLETGLACPDLNNPIYQSLCGLYDTTDLGGQTAHHAYIATPLYQNVRRITNNATGSTFAIAFTESVWEGTAHYTLPTTLTFRPRPSRAAAVPHPGQRHPGGVVL